MLRSALGRARRRASGLGPRLRWPNRPTSQDGEGEPVGGTTPTDEQVPATSGPPPSEDAPPSGAVVPPEDAPSAGDAPPPGPFDPATELSELVGVWDSLARTDPLWAILSDPDKRGRRWRLEEFFEEGRREVDGLIETLAAKGVHPPGRGGAALDFGCGVGRLSRRLRHYFDEVIGVDISPTMVELARQLAEPDRPVRYVVNQQADLGFVPDASLDLVYSNIVLQHMDPELARGYITEFFRIVRPGGAIVFQIPSHISETYLPAGWTETPLEEEACVAGLEAEVPATLIAGQVVELVVEVTNASPHAWVQRRVQQLNLANHWLTADGEMAGNDDGRTRLPPRLEPGEAAVVPLTVTAPATPGSYLLELDVVQEGVRWFTNVGSPTLRRPVEVTPPAAATGAAGPADETMAELAGLPAEPPAEPVAFKMEGVTREEILAMIAELGGELIQTEEHITEWYSYKYFVRRTETAP